MCPSMKHLAIQHADSDRVDVVCGLTFCISNKLQGEAFLQGVFKSNTSSSKTVKLRLI